MERLSNPITKINAKKMEKELTRDKVSSWEKKEAMEKL